MDVIIMHGTISITGHWLLLMTNKHISIFTIQQQAFLGNVIIFGTF